MGLYWIQFNVEIKQHQIQRKNRFRILLNVKEPLYHDEKPNMYSDSLKLFWNYFVLSINVITIG